VGGDFSRLTLSADRAERLAGQEDYTMWTRMKPLIGLAMLGM
jgi:hypothetical protein